MFDRLGAWETLGTIDVDTNVEGAEIRLDGALVGTSRRGVTRLVDARAGPRTISLAASGYAPAEVTAQVKAKGVATVSVRLEESGTTVGTLAFWSGIGLSAAGVAVLTGAIIGQHTQTSGFVCVDPVGCEGSAWLRSGSGTTPEEAIYGSKSGLRYAPFGIGLMLGGGLIAAGSEYFEPDGIPWISMVAGVALGVATYSIMSALDNPQKLTLP